jgi:hypothetical protein
MTSTRTKIPRGEKEFNRWLVSEYFKHGSVDEVLRVHTYDVPISYAQYQRVLDKWGVVKAAGPNSRLAETLEFLTKLAYDNIPFDKLYSKMPSSFRTSAATLYRILSYMKEGVTRRMATALLITIKGNKKKILVANDYSQPRTNFGKKYGSISIPVSFSRLRDPREVAIMRVLQQEVFTNLAVDRKIPDVVPHRPRPFMLLDIADVRVEVFHIELPKKYANSSNFSSYKLQNFKFVDIKSIPKQAEKRKLRIGVREAAEGYLKFLKLKKRNLSTNPIYYKSQLNYQILGDMRF